MYINGIQLAIFIVGQGAWAIQQLGVDFTCLPERPSLQDGLVESQVDVGLYAGFLVRDRRSVFHGAGLF